LACSVLSGAFPKRGSALNVALKTGDRKMLQNARSVVRVALTVLPATFLPASNRAVQHWGIGFALARWVSTAVEAESDTSAEHQADLRELGP